MTEDRDENSHRGSAAVNGADRRLGSARPTLHGGLWIGAALLLVVIAACQNETPTSLDGSLIPTTPLTVELEYSFEEFARNLELFGGFGTNNAFSFGAVNSYVGLGFGPSALEARTLVRFGAPPSAAVVQDTTGASVTDSTLTFLSGSVLVLVDTVQSSFGTGTVLEAGALSTRWSSHSASWTDAVDSVTIAEAWPEPGAGPAESVGTATWDPDATLDTIRLAVDSATVANWMDTTDATRGLRLSTTTDGTLLALRGVSLSVDARPASNPDTVVTLAVALEDLTFIYDPAPTPAPGEIWVGGAPSWRSVFEVVLPETLNGPQALCATAGCPLEVDPDFVTSATLLLHSATTPESFQPRDSIRMIALPVLSPERLPKSPLGQLFTPGVELLPGYFDETTGVEVELPVTTYVKALWTEPAEGETPMSPTLALLAVSEPSSLGFASFAGPESDQPPRLRIVLTIPEPVGLR